MYKVHNWDALHILKPETPTAETPKTTEAPETAETGPDRFPFFSFHFQTVTLGSIHNYHWMFKVWERAQLPSRFLARFSSMLFLPALSSSAAEGDSDEFWAKISKQTPDFAI